MSKRILVLSANPKPNSYTSQLAQHYRDSAQLDHQVQFLDLANMQFDIDLSVGYDEQQTMEESLLSFQDALLWCDHLVIVTPIWWGSVPAKLKGLVDRTFLPGFAFEYESGKSIPNKLLKGRTARVIMTMDTPPWYYLWIQGAPALKHLKRTTLQFVGFGSVKSNMIGPIISSSDTSRSSWLTLVSNLGRLAI